MTAFCFRRAAAVAVAATLSLPATGRAQPVTSSSGSHEAVLVTRDPFVRPGAPALEEETAPAPPVALRGDGPLALGLDDITVRGVLRAERESVALVQGPDKRQYRVRAGDRLRDAVVEAVVADGVLLVRDDRPAESRAEPRSVRKRLRERGEDR